ncbi:MAG: PilZ domain-containing protein [Phycisphaeraceae bacterium]|nr:PilZ domain-containing protein [Phycisphaerae bacterium]MBX3392308.1 PilZ domain-containing protein [Phycisphaeraceae bacterium]
MDRGTDKTRTGTPTPSPTDQRRPSGTMAAAAASETPHGESITWFKGTERRACRRTRVCGDATIAFESPEGGPSTRRIDLIDASIGGLGIRSDHPAQVGSRFTLFPSKVRTSSWTGSVARCMADGPSYVIGLQLSRPAARAGFTA